MSFIFGMADAKDIKQALVFCMDAIIRDEFGLSAYKYECLLGRLRELLGVEQIEDLAFLSAEQFATVTDYWENAAVKRLLAIVTAQIGVEKLWRGAAGVRAAGAGGGVGEAGAV